MLSLFRFLTAVVHGVSVFNVVDHQGKKIRDKEVIDNIKRVSHLPDKFARLSVSGKDRVFNFLPILPSSQRIENSASFAPSLRGSVGVMHSEEHTSIELTGTDRPGLLSEVCAVLSTLDCNVTNAEIWTHNSRAAAVVHVTDDSTGSAIKDPKRLATIKKMLCNILKGNDELNTAKTTLSPSGVTNRGRRLHQIMFADRDYERVESVNGQRRKAARPDVSIMECSDRDYTVVTMRSSDRPKLLFDIVCTLTDMQYVVFHGVVHTGRKEAYQVLS